MRCSICMSTRNRADALAKTLDSIRRQNVPFDYEVIVADDGSTDATQDVCRQFDVRYVYLDSDRYRNPATARNAAYRAAVGDIVIAQSDDVFHHSSDVIVKLVDGLRSDSVLIATVLNMKSDGMPCLNPFPVYSGPAQPRAFFFLGSLWRHHLYAIGGNHEGFIEPCWDDNWFQDCLLRGLQLKLQYAPDVIGHHQSHAFPVGSHDRADKSKTFYYDIRRKAIESGQWQSPGAPWPLTWPTIPKRMAFFWGGEKVSWMRYMTLASFRHYHPDWEMRLYRSAGGAASQWRSSEQEDVASYAGPDYSDKLDALAVASIPWTCPMPGLSVTHASDICQWEVLSSDGGFYADMDVLFVRPLNYADLSQADAVFCLSDGYMTIGFMGASPHSNLFRAILREASQSINKTRYQYTGAEALYRLAGIGGVWSNTPGPGRKTIDWLRRRHPQLRLRTIPDRSIYPWTYLQVERIFAEDLRVPEETLAVHWFGANRTAQEWNQKLTADNFRNYDNTFTRYARLLYDQPRP